MVIDAPEGEWNEMTEEKIKHYLIVFDPAKPDADVQMLGTDYEIAIQNYNATEERYRDNPDVEVVLLSADSVETIKKTHSSYFKGHGTGPARELLAAGHT
jgi:hypothetical protein